jgi:hypothetical protein
MFGILEAVVVPNNGTFATFDELMESVRDRVTKEGYKIVKARSHRGRVGGASIPGNEMVRCDLVCEKGGRPYKSTATKHKTHTKKTDCPWKAKAVYRKTMGGWVLTIECDQHNHEPGTPEPPTPPALDEDAEAVDDVENGQLSAHTVEKASGQVAANTAIDGPRPDLDSSAALQIAGVSADALRLTGDTFHQFKNEYRKMPQPERLGVLSQLQLRVAAIYAVQNEDIQRKTRRESLNRRHQEIEESRRLRAVQKQRARRQQQKDQQPQQQSVGPGQTSLQQQQSDPIPSQTPGQHQLQQHQQQPQHQQPQHHQQLQPSAPHETPQRQQLGQQSHQTQQYQHQAMAQQQFQLAENPGQQLMPMPGMSMNPIPYAGVPNSKRMRGRPSKT